MEFLIALNHLVVPIRPNVGESIKGTIGPTDDHSLDLRLIPQSKMDPFAALRQEPFTGTERFRDRGFCCWKAYFDARADRVSVTCAAFQS